MLGVPVLWRHMQVTSMRSVTIMWLAHARDPPRTGQPLRDLKIVGADTLAERYERTMLRLEQITGAGYTVRLIWECEWVAAKIMEKKPELLTHPIVRHSPLPTRDALYGGLTEAMRLHYK
jgi:G:T-mismatch repair DNA endonuclease (very short patch repair protein)